MRPLSVLFCLAALGTATVLGQDVISARAGLVNYTEGRVLLNGQSAEARGTRFPQMKAGDTLQTLQGRAEVLLDPGTFVRLGEESMLHLVSDSIPAWEIEAVQGSFVLEIARSEQDARATIRWKHGSITPLKRGVYRIDVEPPAVRVFDGEARIQAGDQTFLAGKGRMLSFGQAWEVQRFDRDADDSLGLWSARRAQYLAMANIPAALSSFRGSPSLLGGAAGYWYLNPAFGMMTFVPVSGTYRSFYGFEFYSYRTAYDMLYTPQPRPPRMDGGGGGGFSPAPNYPTSQPTSAGTSGTIAAGSPASTTSAGSTSAPVSRQSGDASGRTR